MNELKVHPWALFLSSVVSKAKELILSAYFVGTMGKETNVKTV